MNRFAEYDGKNVRVTYLDFGNTYWESGVCDAHTNNGHVVVGKMAIGVSNITKIELLKPQLLGTHRVVVVNGLIQSIDGEPVKVLRDGVYQLRGFPDDLKGDEQVILQRATDYINSMRVFHNCLIADPEQESVMTKTILQKTQDKWNELDDIVPRPEGL